MRKETLADGQLGTTAASLIDPTLVPAGAVTVVLSNIASTDETVILTFQRAGGTARRLARRTLAQHQQLIIKNLPIQPSDSLLGVTSNAGAVDYVVVTADDSGPFHIQAMSAQGEPIQSSTGDTEVSGTLELSSVPTMEDLMTEQNSLLRRMLLGLEILANNGHSIPDPV